MGGLHGYAPDIVSGCRVMSERRATGVRDAQRRFVTLGARSYSTVRPRRRATRARFAATRQAPERRPACARFNVRPETNSVIQLGHAARACGSAGGAKTKALPVREGLQVSDAYAGRTLNEGSRSAFRSYRVGSMLTQAYACGRTPVPTSLRNYRQLFSLRRASSAQLSFAGRPPCELQGGHALRLWQPAAARAHRFGCRAPLFFCFLLGGFLLGSFLRRYLLARLLRYFLRSSLLRCLLFRFRHIEAPFERLVEVNNATPRWPIYITKKITAIHSQKYF